MSLTKRDIAVQMAKKLDMIQQDAHAAIQFTLDAIKEELLNDGNVELRNFGVFEIATRKPRVGRNPRLPETDVQIPARKVVKFRMGKDFKDNLNNKN
jgi:nucleoid DNA-binding protein